MRCEGKRQRGGSSVASRPSRVLAELKHNTKAVLIVLMMPAAAVEGVEDAVDWVSRTSRAAGARSLFLATRGPLKNEPVSVDSGG